MIPRRYNIKNYYDAWAGFLYEKARYLEIASMANNAAQYGGDTHADWVGFHSLNGKVNMWNKQSSNSCKQFLAVAVG